jgi:signal transduction histidine kinase
MRSDLNDALHLERELTPIKTDVESQHHLTESLAQFWTSADRMFALSRDSHADQARNLIRTSLQPQQAAITTAIARQLVQNNVAEEDAVTRIQDIYSRVERNIYLFVGAMLVAISITSAYLIYSNGVLFRKLGALSEQRSDLAQRLFTVQEEVLHSISRELHDEFGQILTAIGAMLTRLERRSPAPEITSGLHEVREIVQSTLEKTRSLSQALHPTTLDDAGLEKAIDWYLTVFQKQTGIAIHYEKSGTNGAIANRIAIHVYRVLQEALNNMARHSGSQQAEVRANFSADHLRLEIQDRGKGFAGNGASGHRGIGMVAMRERAELLRGKIEFISPPGGGALVRLDVPLEEAST